MKPLLALEWLQPGEGEDTAALRLLRRLPELYGSRFFDILLLDSLYPQAPLLQLARDIDWDVVITLKQEKRDLDQNAMALFRARAPDQLFCEQSANTATEVQLWHTDGLPFTQDDPEPVRVVWSRERVTQQHRRPEGLQPETTDHEWIWITTLDAKAFPAPVVRGLGHQRWKQENNGWNDLTQNWALKHGFLQTPAHEPRARRSARPGSQPWPDGSPADPMPGVHLGLRLYANQALRISSGASPSACAARITRRVGVGRTSCEVLASARLLLLATGQRER